MEQMGMNNKYLVQYTLQAERKISKNDSRPPLK